MGYLMSIFGGGGLEVFGIYRLPLNLGIYFLMQNLNTIFYMLLWREVKKAWLKIGVC